MRNALLAFGVVLLAVACSSCGGATAALVALLSARKDPAPAASPTVVSDVQPASGVARKVSPLGFTFRLTDENSEPAEVEVLYSLAGATPIPALLVGGVGLSQLATSPQGVVHGSQWDFAGQLPAGGSFAQDVRLIVRMSDLSGTAVSAAFDLGNDPPSITVVSSPGGELSSVVKVPLALSDSSSDTVTVSAEYMNLDAGGAWNPATSLGTALAGLATSPGGVSLLFLWDVEADEPRTEFRAKLRFTPDDGTELGAPAETAVLTIDNNSEPLVLLEGSAFVADPDRRRGIPVPFQLIDEEGDAAQIVFQWRRTEEAFPDLPDDPAALGAILASEDLRKQFQVASELPRAFGGTVVPAGVSQVRLPELGSEAAGLLHGFIATRPLEILRRKSPLAPLAPTWASNPLSSPAAALPVDAGTFAVVLDTVASGTWRLRQVDIATGAVLGAIATGTDGDPDALAYDANGASLLVAADTGGIWAISRVDQVTGGVTPLITAGGSLALGKARALVPLNEQRTLLTVGNSLIAVDAPASGAVTATTLINDLQGAWGMALHPRNRARLYVAEHDWVNPSTGGVDGRVVVIDLATLSKTLVAATGTVFRRPSSLAIEGAGARLLLLTDSGAGDGTLALRGIDLAGGFGGQAYLIGGGYPPDSSGLIAGADDLRMFCMPSDDDLQIAGGVQQERAITAFSASNLQAEVASPFDPPLDPRQSWRIMEQTLTVPPGPTTRSSVFVWDSRDLGGSGSVVLGAFAYDTERGLATDTGVPRGVLAGIDVVPSKIGGTGLTNGVASLAAADLNGDGLTDIASANTAANTVTLFFQTSSGAFPAAPSATLQGLPLVAPMQAPAAVALVDADTDGDWDLATANRTSNNLTVFLQTSPGTFVTQPLSLGTGLSAPSDLTAADLNADGRPDLVAASFGSDRIALFFQNPGGLYSPSPSLVIGNGSTLGPRRVALGDLNSDGIIDIVTANANSNNLAVFLGQAPGVFAAAPSLVRGGPGVTDGVDGVVVADLDGDGRLDIASSNRGRNNLTIFLQGAGGAFPAAPSITLTSSNGPVQPEHLAAGDINGDGSLDLLSTNGANDVTVFLFRPATADYAPEPLVVQGAPSDLQGPVLSILEDLDGDGLVDFATANATGNDIALFRQTNAGSFAAQAPDLVLGNAQDTPGVSGLAAGDVNGDGQLDLVAASEASGTVSVFVQLAPAIFGDQPTYVLGGLPQTAGAHAVATADLNADGLVDIASANRTAGTVAVYHQQVDHSFTTSPELVLGNGSLREPVWLSLADLNADGLRDVACAESTGDDIAVFLQAPGGFPSTPTALLGSSGTTRGPAMVFAADLDGDGAVDLVTANTVGNSLAVFLQKPGGVFTVLPDATLGGPGKTSSPRAVWAVDLDRDGDVDLVSANGAGDSLTVFLASSPGSFPVNPSLKLNDAAVQQPTTLAIADVDLDGYYDLICGNSGTRNMAIFFQRAPGQFASPPRTFGGPSFTDSPSSMVVTDLDGDGDLDILAAEPPLDNLSLFFGSH